MTKRQYAGRVCVAIWLVSLPVVTRARTLVWQSDESLWTDAATKAPLKPRAVMNRGRAAELLGHEAIAEASYRRVIGLSFDTRRSVYIQRFSRAAAETNLAHLYIKRGWHATAMRVLDSTLAEYPDFPYAHYNRGSILWVQGACEEARLAFTRAFYGDPTLPGPTGTCAPSPSTP